MANLEEWEVWKRGSEGSQRVWMSETDRGKEMGGAPFPLSPRTARNL